jgi:hypothetical protein
MAKDKVWTEKDGQPPKEPDDASAGKVDKKNLPEQLGSGIIVKKAKGGSVSARADGIASRGKTRGKMC